MRGAVWVGVVLLAAGVTIGGLVVGLWWAAFPVGFALGVAVGRGRRAVPAGAAAGLVAWLIPLVVNGVRFGLGPTATALAAIMGFTHKPAIPVILTLLVGTLLGLTGAWLGSAARGIVAPNVRVDAARNG